MAKQRCNQMHCLTLRRGQWEVANKIQFQSISLRVQSRIGKTTKKQRQAGRYHPSQSPRVDRWPDQPKYKNGFCTWVRYDMCCCIYLLYGFVVEQLVHCAANVAVQHNMQLYCRMKACIYCPVFNSIVWLIVTRYMHCLSCPELQWSNWSDLKPLLWPCGVGWVIISSNCLVSTSEGDMAHHL